jgi:hypothetical protein
MPPKEKYTDPKLRDEVKEEIHNSDKGGAPGQWSARKAQMMAQECVTSPISPRRVFFLTSVPRYKNRGGGYNTDKSQQDESQKHLSEWTEEEWQTKEGSGHAKKDDGTEKRYLPKKAWEQMREKEKEETEEKKEEGSKEGKQYAGNTEKAKESRKEVSGGKGEKKQKSKSKKGDDGEDDDHDDDEEYQDDGADEEEEEEVADDENVDAAAGEDDDEVEYQDDGADEQEVEEDEGVDDDDEVEGQNGDGEEAKTGQKRSRGQQNGSNKSQKNNSGKAQSKQSNGNKNGDDSDKDKSKSNGTVGSKHQKDEDPAPKGSADRLPKKGQAAQWKSLPGFVKGKVEDILTEAQEVDGKNVKASEKDPRIVLKSDSSGKICVHKPEACYYD